MRRFRGAAAAAAAANKMKRHSIGNMQADEQMDGKSPEYNGTASVLPKADLKNRNFEQFLPSYFMSTIVPICARCCLCLLKDSEGVKIREQFYWCIGIPPVLIQRDLAVSSVRNRHCKCLLHEINVSDSFRTHSQYFLDSYLQESTILPEFIL